MIYDRRRNLVLGSFNNYVDEKRGKESLESSCYVTCHRVGIMAGGGGVKIGLNLVYVVVECPLLISLCPCLFQFPGWQMPPLGGSPGFLKLILLDKKKVTFKGGSISEGI